MVFVAAHPNNFKKGRDGQKIKYIIIHSIVGSAASAIATFKKPDRIASSHYIIAWNGIVTQMVNDEDTAYHAGDWTTNTQSIGIEHDDQAQPNIKRPAELYTASASLVFNLCKKYKIPISRTYIKKHSQISATACPAGLDIDRIVREAKAKEVNMAQTWYEKDIAAKAAEIANLKKSRDAKATELAQLKNTIAIQYIRKTDHEASLLSTIKEYQISIDGLEGELANSRQHGVEIGRASCR